MDYGKYLQFCCINNYTKENPMKKFAAFLLSSLLLAQYDYSLVDINPTSDTYEDSVGTSYFEETITLHYFGYFT